MNGCLIDLDRPRVNETDLVNIAVEFLFDGRSTSECRSHLRNEYDVDADGLGRLLERA
jgi:hypothetical protein